MSNVCLIGGGQREPILRAALESMPTSPNVLLVPSACSTASAYDKKVAAQIKQFAALGVAAEVLHTYGQAPSPTERAEKFGRATMIYTIAGNSPHMLRSLREHGTDQDIIDASAQGKMLAGSSAGALLPFDVGHSNPSAKKGAVFEYTCLPMLGIIPAAAAMHADIIDPPKSVTRLQDFTARFPGLGHAYGLAINNNAGLLVIEGTPSIERSAETAAIHVVTMAGEQAVSHVIENNDHMMDVWRGINAAA
jgi:cyanophycinase-like exopeptidase